MRGLITNNWIVVIERLDCDSRAQVVDIIIAATETPLTM
jgi:hypothetical protein